LLPGGLAIVLASGLAVPAQAEEKAPAPECRAKGDKFRKIDEHRTGNCIFSTKKLPRCEEEHYTDVRDTFTDGQDTAIYARCYLAATMGEIRKELADKNLKMLAERTRLVVDGQERDPRFSASIVYPHLSPDWTFASLNTLLGSDRDFKSGHFEELSRGKKGPHTVCIYQTYQAESGGYDVTRTKTGVHAEKSTEEPILATGCFTWVVP
jgi:hypothetical protein